MPTYQYACTACDHRFDEVQKFTDPSLTECPECSGRLRKLYGSVGVVFKGSGFYRTDSRAKASAAEKGSGDKGSGSGEKSGTESKPASTDKPSSTSSTTSTTTPTAKAS